MKTTTYALLVLLLLTGLWPIVGRGQTIYTNPDGSSRTVYKPGDGEPETFVQASFDLAHQYIKEKTKYAQFISEDDRVYALNVFLNRGDFDWARKFLDKYTQRNEPNRWPVPPELATLVAANDTLPGPTASTSSRSSANRASWGQIGFFYGVQLIGKGSGFTNGATRMTYLEPVAYATYSYVLPGNKGRLFAGLGPYIALGLWGKIKSGNYSSSTFDSQTGYSRFDVGVYLTTGYQHPQGLRLSVAREIGLVNIQKNSPDEQIYNRVWSLNVGYPLKKLSALIRKK